MKTIRCGRGLGDAMYLQAACNHLAERGIQTTAMTDFPDVFAGTGVPTQPFRRLNVDICAHYSMRKSIKATNQWQDVLIGAKLDTSLPLDLKWTNSGSPIVDQLKQHGKPIVLIDLPRAPMARNDGFANDLLPDCRVIQKAIDELRGQVLLVQIGHGTPMFEFQGIDVDLNGKTKIKEVMDLGQACDAMIGYCSFFVPLSEGFNKPALFVWSRKGTRSPQAFVRTITPEKILSKPSSKWVFDDQPHLINQAARDLL